MDRFKITYAVGDNWVCTSQGNWADNETSVHKAFLEAHYLVLGDVFTAEVDDKGHIILESIQQNPSKCYQIV